MAEDQERIIEQPRCLCMCLLAVAETHRCSQDLAAAEEAEMLQEGLSAAAELEARLARWQLQRLLGGPYDEGNALLSIQARPSLSILNGLHV